MSTTHLRPRHARAPQPTDRVLYVFGRTLFDDNQVAFITNHHTTLDQAWAVYPPGPGRRMTTAPTTNPVPSPALKRELAYFDQMAQTTAADPHLHQESTLWRAPATEVRAYLNPGTQLSLLDAQEDS